MPAKQPNPRRPEPTRSREQEEGSGPAEQARAALIGTILNDPNTTARLKQLAEGSQMSLTDTVSLIRRDLNKPVDNAANFSPAAHVQIPGTENKNNSHSAHNPPPPAANQFTFRTPGNNNRGR